MRSGNFQPLSPANGGFGVGSGRPGDGFPAGNPNVPEPGKPEGYGRRPGGVGAYPKPGLPSPGAGGFEPGPATAPAGAARLEPIGPQRSAGIIPVRPAAGSLLPDPAGGVL